MVSPVTQSQITFPVGLARPTAREDLWWLAAACRLLETRLMQVGTKPSDDSTTKPFAACALPAGVHGAFSVPCEKLVLQAVSCV